MDYRQWEHESRDPRDRGTARPPWSSDDDGDEYRYDGGYDTPRQRQISAYRWEREEGWSDPLDAPYEGTSTRHTDSWQAGTGWSSARRDEPEDDFDVGSRYPSNYPAGYTAHYPDDYPAGYTARYPDDLRSGYPDPDPPPGRWHDGRVLDHDDWYEHPPAAPLPATRRPAEMVHVPRRTPARRPHEDEDEAQPGHGYLSAVLAAAVWCAVPVALYVLWALTRGGTPEPNCVDPAGNPCAAPRTEALTALVDNLPRLATAFGLSLALALIVRWSNATWRAATVGFASAVVGAGIATLVFTLVAPR